MKNSLRCFTALVALMTVVTGLLTAPPSAVSGDSRPTSQVPAAPPTAISASTSNEHPALTPPRSPLPAPRSSHPAPSTQPAIGDRLLMEAASRLERRRSVTARLRHQVLIDRQQLYGVGFYWQEGRGDDLKIRLELQIAGQESRLLQVSNSRFQWLDRSLPAGRTISRVDLRQLRAVLAATNTSEVRPGEASWSPAQTDITTNCGGLPRLLAALMQNFTFLPPQAMRLVPAQGREPTGVPYFAVVGHWRPEKLAALLESQEPTIESQEQAPERPMPDRLPQEVLLLVDQEELFPYRIEYRPLETPRTQDPSGRAIPYQLSTQPLVVLEFTNVAFDLPIAAGHFDYAPPHVDWIDHTAAAIERITRERQAQVAAQSTSPQRASPAR